MDYRLGATSGPAAQQAVAEAAGLRSVIGAFSEHTGLYSPAPHQPQCRLTGLREKGGI